VRDVSGRVSGRRDRAGDAVVAAAGRRHRPAGVRAGARGFGSQSPDAVPRAVPQQTRTPRDVCRVSR